MARASLIGKERPDKRLERRDLRFRRRDRTGVRLSAGRFRGSIDDAPLEVRVPVQIHSDAGHRAGPVTGVRVLPLQIALLGEHAPVGVRDRNDHDEMLVEQPGHVAVDAIAAQQVIDEAQGQLRRGELARVNGGHEEQRGLRTGTLPIGELDPEQIVPGRGPLGDPLPATAVHEDLGQVRVLAGVVVQRGAHLADGPVAAHEQLLLRQ